MQSLEQSFEESLGGFGVTACLNQDIEHDTVLIDGAPEIVRLALDPDEHRIEVPFVAWFRPTAAQDIGKVLAELAAPPPNALIRNNDAPLRQQQITSRRLKLNTWYSQTAWLMSSAGKRWR